MAMRDDLHVLVDALSEEQAPTALTYLRRLTTTPSRPESDPLSERMGPATVSGQTFLTSPPATAASLAAAQGVPPIASLEALKTDVWPTDPAEDPDLFSQTLRRWRQEDGHA